MFYVYLLQSPGKNQIYIGYTEDLKRRYKEHQQLQRHKEWSLVYYEAFRNREDAMKRERQLKSYGAALHQLKRRIARSLEGLE
jgi:putative endonuclease